jgi:glutathione S-transferase
MIVFGSSLSPFVRKTLAFIAEKGLTTERRPIPPHDPLPQFRACSPLGKIPAFEDGDFRISDSSAICHYLERKHPERPLFPEAPADFARTVWYEEFADTALIGAAGKVFFNLVVKKLMRLGEPDMEMVQTALDKELPPLFAYLDGAIDGPYLVGDRFTLADIAVASPFVNLQLAGHPLDPARWPKLAAWLAPILARPSFVNARD